MKNLLASLFPVAVCGALYFAARPVTGELAAYRQLTPMVAIHATSLADALHLLNDGLAGAGEESRIAACSKTLADFCFLPSFDGIDMRQPIRYFLLSQNPPVAMPEQAVILPLLQNGSKTLLGNLRERYAFVEGGSIKICSEPTDGKSIDPLYVAIADGNAMLSPNVDAIRWMAFNLQSKTIPAPPDFRQAPLSASADARQLGLLLKLIAPTDEDISEKEEATDSNMALAVRELGVFLSAFQRAEITLDASISQWDASLRLVGAAGSPIAEAIAALKPPDDTWMKLFPNYACNHSASCLPGFVAALPASNRKWLSDLAVDTGFVGFSVIPFAFNLDEKLRPHLAGTALSAFVTDMPNGKFGSVTVSSVKSPNAAMQVLRSYFATNGAASANNRMSNVIPQGRNGTTSYKIAASNGSRKKTELSSAIEAVSLMLDLNNIEFAIRGNRLFIVRGTPGLIDPWLADSHPVPWNERFSSLTATFPNQPGETILGGGSLEPVTIARRIVGAIPNLRQQLPKMPHPGSGLAWRMARKSGEAIFDLRLYSNEIIACNRLLDVNSDTLQQILPQLVIGQSLYGNDTPDGRKREKKDDTSEK